ncbi:unnamed protein product [Linum trigynum]|uniref:Uncharacterized protein n=1 Tax=Linum trigynum TaxID=586398 RepID=A0AAV2DW77_9ROSI
MGSKGTTIFSLGEAIIAASEGGCMEEASSPLPQILCGKGGGDVYDSRYARRLWLKLVLLASPSIESLPISANSYGGEPASSNLGTREAPTSP